MRLYHFTYAERVPSILKDGINRGDVPTSLDGGFNAPWLTSDPAPHAQDWTVGSPGKTGARITVDVPDDDEKLMTWRDVATLYKVSEKFYQALHTSGGGGSENWYVYMGTVPPRYLNPLPLILDPTRTIEGLPYIGTGFGQSPRDD